MSGLGHVNGIDADCIVGALIATHSRKLQVGNSKNDMLNFIVVLEVHVLNYYKSSVLDLEHPI